ncbi:MAG: response regulator [bacterium]|nr:response regulator [bacterium]
MKTVLIAEDNDDLRTIFYKAFDKTIFDVRTAIDGEDAIAKIDQLLPDIIILDVDMPKISGFEVLRYLQNADLHPAVILVTGNTIAADSPEAENADLVLVKPVSIRELITFVKRFTNN